MKSFLNKWKSLPTISVALLAVFFVVTVVGSATVISTSIQTDGTLSVTGTSTLLGNVGVGTTTTTYGLNVAGDINLLNVGTATSSLRISGSKVLSVPNENSIYLGVGAGANAGSSTNYSTAVGFNALGTSGAGLYNVAVGWGALAANTTGGDNNVAVGLLALNANTTAHANTALGEGSMQFTTTGEGNTGVGFHSLFVNTTGIHNAAVGANALVANTTANQNTAIGEASLAFTTTGSDNVGVGFQAGYPIGGLSQNITGSRNTFIGTVSGPASSTLTNATALGYGSIVGASNTIVLGGTGIYAVNVGIGTTTPATRLHISSGANATTTVTIGELGLTTSKACVNMNRSDGGPASFFINAAGTMVVSTSYCQ
jgi:trimeric autotransporter adhesin